MKMQTMKSWTGLMVLAALTLGGRGLNAATDKPAAKPAAKTVQSMETYVVDPASSEIRWIGKKVTGQHNGTVNVKSGEIHFAQGKPSNGSVIVDMGSIKVLDLTDADSNGKLTGHLKSEDFFSTDKNPTAAFKITELKPMEGAAAGQPNYMAKGDLMIKGTSHPLEFPVTIVTDGKTAKASATGVTVDRTLYNIRYGSGKFFQNLGNKAIDDKFTLDFNVTANKK